MQVLISAASRHGSTAEIAEFIAGALRARGIDAVCAGPGDVTTVAAYDAVVIGSGVYAGHWLGPAKDLVDRCGAELRTKPVWIFSSGHLGDPPKPAEEPADVPRMLDATGARDHRLFAAERIGRTRRPVRGGGPPMSRVRRLVSRTYACFKNLK